MSTWVEQDKKEGGTAKTWDDSTISWDTNLYEWDGNDATIWSEEIKH